jgi:hypothetical protein
MTGCDRSNVPVLRVVHALPHLGEIDVHRPFSLRERSRRSLQQAPVALLAVLVLTVWKFSWRPCSIVEDSWPSVTSSTSRSRVVLLDPAAETAAQLQRPLVESTTLIIVAGHAIYRGKHWDAASVRDEVNWYLEPSQHGQVDTFLAHVRKGVELASLDSSSILLFSGGQTRPGLGPRSEGSSYWQAAEAFDWFGFRERVQNRSHAEEVGDILAATHKHSFFYLMLRC